jgi:hypothetical protein
MLNVNGTDWSNAEAWLALNCSKADTKWLGDGTTSDKIIEILKEKL